MNNSSKLLDKLFDDPGLKLEKITKVLYAVLSVLSVLAGIILLFVFDTEYQKTLRVICFFAGILSPVIYYIPFLICCGIAKIINYCDTY